MPEPMKTADGSPSRRASVSSSAVVLRTVPSTWSTRTRTSVMDSLSRSLRSDELLAGQELDQLVGSRAVLVGHDGPGRARRPRLEAGDLGPGGIGTDLTGVDTEVGQRDLLDRLLLRGHDPLERRV